MNMTCVLHCLRPPDLLFNNCDNDIQPTPNRFTLITNGMDRYGCSFVRFGCSVSSSFVIVRVVASRSLTNLIYLQLA